MISGRYEPLGDYKPFSEQLKPLVDRALKVADEIQQSTAFRHLSDWKDTAFYSPIAIASIAEIASSGKLSPWPLMAVFARESIRSVSWDASREYAFVRGRPGFFHPRTFAETARAGSMLATIPLALSLASHGYGDPGLCKVWAAMAGVGATADMVNVGGPIKIIKNYMIIWNWNKKNARLGDPPPDGGEPIPEESGSSNLIVFPAHRASKPDDRPRTGTYGQHTP